MFGKSKGQEPQEGAPVGTWDVTYKGGVAELPKAKVGKVRLAVYDDRFELTPTSGSQKWWTAMVLPFSEITSFAVVDRTVSTFEALAGGVDSRQLNQANVIQIGHGAGQMLRVEMLSGVTVMGQAKKCQEMLDALRVNGILDRLNPASGSPATSSSEGGGDLGSKLRELGDLRDAGVLDEAEFAAAKAKLLS